MATTRGLGEAIGYLAFFGLLFNGCVHSCKKHKDDPQWLAYSPAAIYRGVEFFWHDDFAGVDWDKRLSSDVYVAFELMLKIENTTEVESLSNEFEKFGNKISNYPKDKKEYLKKALIQFINYSMAISDDMAAFVGKIKDGEDVEYKEWNTSSKPFQDTLINKYELRELEAAKKQVDSAMLIIFGKYRFGEITSSEMEKMQNEFKQAKIKQFNVYLRFYKILFDEAFPNSDSYL